MKTTELYIEQVIIGFLVIAIAALPWAPELKFWIGESKIVESAVLLGMAFLLGIPFDRFADTLSERLDHHHRLQFALDMWERKCFPNKKSAPADDQLEEDIFAEDKYRHAGLREKEGVVNWIDYHRSRIRLARALAVYGPALTLSSTLSMARRDYWISPTRISILLCAVAFAYLLWGIVASLETPFFGGKLPRTNKGEFGEYAKKRGRIDEQTQRVKKVSRAAFRVWTEEWRTLVVPLLVLLAALLFGLNYKGKAAWIAVCGALVTVISAWSWWRISTTYRTYLLSLKA